MPTNKSGNTILMNRSATLLLSGFLFFQLCYNSGFAQSNSYSGGIKQRIAMKMVDLKERIQENPKKEKLVLTGLTITLGSFGVHRLYLGTSAHVPAVYTLSAGGIFMIVPIIDLVHIIAAEDLEKV